MDTAHIARSPWHVSLDELTSLAELRTGRPARPLSPPIKVAINGFGRIGRPVLRILMQNPNFEVVAINQRPHEGIMVKHLAQLFQFDSFYGKYPGTVAVEKDNLVIDGKRIQVVWQTDASRLAWDELGVEYVIESTGNYDDVEDAEVHVRRGAKRSIVTAAVTGESQGRDIEFVLGLNHEQYDPRRHTVVGISTCTTNCWTPMVKVAEERFGIQRGSMVTVHVPTLTQNLVDGANDDLRRGRAAMVNTVPTSTGAEKSVFKIFPHLKGKLTARAYRVPGFGASLVDFTWQAPRPVTVAEVNQAYRAAAANELNGILAVTDKPLVSTDFKGDPHSVTIDLGLTKVEGDQVTVVGWYDNEWAFAQRVVDGLEYVVRVDRLAAAPAPAELGSSKDQTPPPAAPEEPDSHEGRATDGIRLAEAKVAVPEHQQGAAAAERSFASDEQVAVIDSAFVDDMFGPPKPPESSTAPLAATLVDEDVRDSLLAWYVSRKGT